MLPMAHPVRLVLTVIRVKTDNPANRVTTVIRERLRRLNKNPAGALIANPDHPARLAILARLVILVDKVNPDRMAIPDRADHPARLDLPDRLALPDNLVSFHA